MLPFSLRQLLLVFSIEGHEGGVPGARAQRHLTPREEKKTAGEFDRVTFRHGRAPRGSCRRKTPMPCFESQATP